MLQVQSRIILVLQVVQYCSVRTETAEHRQQWLLSVRPLLSFGRTWNYSSVEVYRTAIYNAMLKGPLIILPRDEECSPWTETGL